MRATKAISLLAILIFAAIGFNSISRDSFALSSDPNVPSNRTIPTRSSLLQVPVQTDIPRTANTTARKDTNKLTALPARADPSDFPLFDDFFADIRDLDFPSSQAQNARGVYVDGVFALPVIQQPEDRPVYVSNRPNLLTQFQSASRYGVTGLLAHNYLSGKEFYKLGLGQEVRVIYGDGSIGSYRVSDIQRFQKMVPSSSRSHYIEVATGNEMTTEQVFRRFYRSRGQVTFQTCLEGNGLLNWGLLFVVAEPTD